ncbi:AMP-binding protein [Marinobacter pelagius]|uniref:Acetyl-CoA synthetase n=1 Tax=Marinobacter pelagius TaxID=379482 RepID=A0A1I4XEG2_9GAMM|nr:AMP-binding protein [Marinobacter pelagius]SFN24301.1 acetyl-CoA synthetase [Marinobacter pelagius]
MNKNNTFLEARNFLISQRINYEDAVDQFKWPQLSEFNWALDYFDYIASGNHNPALHIINDEGDDDVYSFDQISRRSNQVANFLEAQGVCKGDRVLLMLGNEVALWEVMLASIKIGAVIIPTSELLVEEDLLDRIHRGGAKFLITNSNHLNKFERFLDGMTSAICVDLDSNLDDWISYKSASAFKEDFKPREKTLAHDPLLLYFTSGTTSKPKLVLHSHQSYPVGSLTTMYWIGLKPNDVHMNISSPGWAKHAWSCFFAPWNAEACIFIYNSSRFNAKSLLSVLTSYPVNTLCAPATVWRMLVQEDLSAVKSRLELRELVGAGEPLNPEVIQKIQKAWGIIVRDGYGQSETTALIGNTPGQRVKPGKMGRPLPGYEVVLLDDRGIPAQEGEVALKIDNKPTGLMLCYEDSEEKTNEVMAEGFYRTGDTASRDSEGYITFIGRADDVFKSSDYRISPFELESILMQHPAVVEVAVIPVDDPVRLYLPKAYLVLSETASEKEEDVVKDIFNFISVNMAPYKRVRFIQIIDEFPKTISGKIRRVDLRKFENKDESLSLNVSREYGEKDFI